MTTVFTAQRRTALQLANERRVTYHHFKRHLASLPRKDGCALVARLLREEDETLMAIRIEAVLMSLAGFGHTKTQTVLRAADVTAVVKRRVRDLSPRQREVIASALEDFR